MDPSDDDPGTSPVQPEDLARPDAADRLNRPGEAYWLPARWYSERDRAAHEAHMRRDDDLRRTMALEATLGRVSRVWTETVRPDLFTYGVRVLPKKIVTGEIFAMMAAVNGPRASDLALPSLGPQITDTEAHDMATDVVVWALERFHDVIVLEWDPAFDATFRTFFIGKCCHGFAGVYRKWLRARRNDVLFRIPDDLPDHIVPIDRSQRPAEAAVIRVQIDHYFQDVDGVERDIALLDAMEWTDPEIGEQLGVTPKVVEYRLRKLRHVARLDWGDESAFRENGGEVA